MTGSKGNSEFCFPETLNVPRGEQGWHTNLPQFQGAQPDQVRVESSSCCLPRELMSFVRPRELVSFDQSENASELGGTTTLIIWLAPQVGKIYALLTILVRSRWLDIIVEPRFNEPLLNKVLDITNDIISMSRPKLQ